jgi:hypothetical protein
MERASSKYSAPHADCTSAEEVSHVHRVVQEFQSKSRKRRRIRNKRKSVLGDKTEEFLEVVGGDACVPDSWLSLLNFDILRFSKLRNGHIGEGGMSIHDFTCRYNKHNVDDFEYRLAGRSPFGLCKFVWNFTTIILLIIAFVYSIHLLSGSKLSVAESAQFVDQPHAVPTLAVRMLEEFDPKGEFNYALEVVHSQIPQASDSTRTKTVTYASPGSYHSLLLAANATTGDGDGEGQSNIQPLEICSKETNVAEQDATDYLSAQIYKYYCLPTDLFIQGTFGSPLYQYLSIRVKALSINAPAVKVSFASRSFVLSNEKFKSRWDTLLFNGRTGMDHIRHELFYVDATAAVQSISTGILPETMLPPPTKKYAEFSRSFVRQTSYENTTGFVLTLYIRSSQLHRTKVWYPQGQIVAVAAGLGGYYVSVPSVRVGAIPMCN